MSLSVTVISQIWSKTGILKKFVFFWAFTFLQRPPGNWCHVPEQEATFCGSYRPQENWVVLNCQLKVLPHLYLHCSWHPGPPMPPPPNLTFKKKCICVLKGDMPTWFKQQNNKGVIEKDFPHSASTSHLSHPPAPSEIGNNYYFSGRVCKV